MTIRTDFALEAKQLWEQSAEKTTKLQGVRARTRFVDGTEVTQVDILDERGAQALKKPIGRYVTLSLPRRSRPREPYAQTLAALLGEMTGFARSVLFVGLGNAAVTLDALGPRVAEKLLITRHLRAEHPRLFGGLRSVCAVCPGVSANTGIESAELVRGAVAHTAPDCVIVVDALAAASPDRLCTSLQLTDTGIVPGSGVGNRRTGFDRRTLGVPVFALGAATVADAAALRPEAEERLIVTPRDIDAQIARLSDILADAINRALYPELSPREIAEIVET